MRPSFLLLALVAFVPAASLAATSRAASPPTKADIARYADQLLADTYAANGPGGVVEIARGDEVLYRGVRGMADIGSARALAAGDLFRIGSVSKQFAAAGLLKLVEAGKVSLADPVSKYVPGFPNGEHITVLELLNHTSGVKSYTSLPAFMDGPLDKDVSTAKLIATFKDEKPDFAPGAGWAYDNSGYVLVGAVIEAASGEPWHQYLREALFAPLGLAHTGYGGDPVFSAQLVSGYAIADGKAGPSKPISMTIPHAAGGLVSTVDDLVKWNRALHEGKVLKDADYVRMITPVGKAVDAKYGFGIEHDQFRGHDLLAHSGGIFGFASMVEYVQGPDVSVVVLQNTDSNDGHDSPEVLARKLAALALGAPYPAKVAVPVDVAALHAVEGVYPVDDRTARVLRVVDGGLTAQRTGGERKKLIPIAKDKFLYEDGLNRFTVVRDPAGAVTGMRFYPDGEGDGVVVARSAAPLPGAHQQVPLRQAELDRVLGTYQKDGHPLKVFLDGKRLMTQLAGQPAFEILAESPSVFFLTVVDATLTFAEGKDHAPGVTLHQGGATVEFTRLP